jgi:hypothetical protein
MRHKGIVKLSVIGSEALDPTSVGSRSSAAYCSGTRGAEFQNPTPNTLVSNIEATFGENILDITETQREAAIFLLSGRSGGSACAKTPSQRDRRPPPTMAGSAVKNDVLRCV